MPALHTLFVAVITANALTTGALAVALLWMRRKLREMRGTVDELFRLVRECLTPRVVVIGNGSPDDVSVALHAFGKHEANGGMIRDD